MVNDTLVREYKDKGYIVLKNVIDKHTIQQIREECIRIKNRPSHIDWNKRIYGNGYKWFNIECASEFSTVLYKFYTSKLLFDIASTLLNTKDIWLFNDQINAKLPNEREAVYPLHHDNMYGPDPKASARREFETINLSISLDTSNVLSGCMYFGDEPCETEAGDIVAIDGECEHYSNVNKSEETRIYYTCVYGDTNVGAMSWDNQPNKRLVPSSEKGFYKTKWTYQN